MIFSMQENVERDERTYTLRVSLSEIVPRTMYDFDRAVIRECEASGKVSDKLLALETIVRRIEESAATESRKADKGQG
jgi:hypothetical protein